MAAVKAFVMIVFSDLHHGEALSPEVSRLSLSPDTRLCPSPPLSATLTANRKPPGIRARRLRHSQTNSEHSPDLSRVGRSPGTGTTAGDTDLTLQRVQQWTRTDVPLLPLPAHIPHPPPTSALGKELMVSRYGIINVYFYIPMCMHSRYTV